LKVSISKVEVEIEIAGKREGGGAEWGVESGRMRWDGNERWEIEDGRWNGMEMGTGSRAGVAGGDVLGGRLFTITRVPRSARL
jgi:hypothetical protein